MSLPSKFTAVITHKNGAVVTCTEQATGEYLTEWLENGKLVGYVYTEASIQECIADGTLKDFKEIKWLH